MIIIEEIKKIFNQSEFSIPNSLELSHLRYISIIILIFL